MLLSLLFAVATAKPIEAKIVAASMFKNGYAVVMREMDVPGPGSWDLTRLPQATMGTLWFSASDGMSLDSVQTATSTSAITIPATDLSQILAINVGKKVFLGTKDGDSITGQSMTGTILSAAGDAVVLKTDKGTIAIPKSTISSLSSQGELLYSTPGSNTTQALRFTTSGRGGHISMISLEQGLQWDPGYAVDISNKDKLTLIGKATVVNDLEDLKNVDARFVTGFPHMEWAGDLDSLIAGTGLRMVHAEPQDSIATQKSMRSIGGFGGGRDSANAPVSEGMPVSGAPGESLEDLFFYHQPNVTIGRGDRAYYTLFRTETPYKEIYTWDLTNPIVSNTEYRTETPQDDNNVWHSVSFKNTSGHPLTTAPAMTMQNGQILGQDTMPYVSQGAEAEVKITKALDIQTESSEEEVSRVRGAIKAPNNYPLYDQVTLKGTLEATNRKSEAVSLRIRHDFTGELVSADENPDVKKTAQGLKAVNPTGRLSWTKTIEPGQKLHLTYTYQVFVKTQ
jgi:hypothetical protein